MHWDMDVLLNGVGSWDMVRHLDDLLHRVVHRLVDWVWLGHANLDRVWDVLLHWVWDVLLNRVRHGDLLDHGHRLLVVGLVLNLVVMAVLELVEVVSTKVMVENSTLILLLFRLRRDWFHFFGLLVLGGHRT